MSLASDVAHQLRDLMVGTAYNGSWDKRHEENFLGVHRCWGNTFSVNGAINNATAEVIDDNNLRCHIYYSGNYTRSNYVEPCMHHHDENLQPSGEIIFKLTIRLLQAPVVTWEEVRNLSPVGGMDHDSNLYTVEAVRAAVIQRLFS